jgi:hypothetical protein
MYHVSIKKTEDDIQGVLKRVNELTGIKESDTGLAPPAHWDLAADKQTLQSMSQVLFYWEGVSSLWVLIVVLCLLSRYGLIKCLWFTCQHVIC